MTSARKTTILLLLLTLATLTACRHTQQIATPVAPQNTETHSGTEAHASIQCSETLLNCTAEGTSVDLLMRHQHDSVIWITARKIIELGRMRLTKDSAECYIKITNNHFVGTYKDLYQTTGYKTNFDSIQMQIEEALGSGATQTTYDIVAPKIGINTTLYLSLQRTTQSDTPLHYPFSIPQNSKPLWIEKK